MDRNEAIEICKLLNSLIEFTQVEKILSSFIPAFYSQSIQKEDGNWYLHSNFKLGGTVSGRMSSPLLMTIPSNSHYGKLIKSCFKSNKDKVLTGADFNALEAVINALITKDPNKLRPLAEGIDSHAFNAYGYYPHKFPDIILANENEQCYKANVGNTDICFKASDSIIFNNVKYTGQEFYEMVTDKKL